MYRLLSSLYYKDINEYNRVYEDRYNSESAVHLNIKIGNYEAFYLVTPQVTELIEKIFILNSKLKYLYQAIPRGITNYVMLSMMKDEIVQTNDIEGIYSSRSEITLIIDDNEKNISKLENSKRLYGMVHKYQKLLNNEKISLYTVEDIRELYDDLVLKDLKLNKDVDNFPDGKLFRKEAVSVYSPTNKEEHKGISGENNIILFMQKALEILNSDSNQLINISIFHYLFGYAHPFYDGNGRMSRFISSYKLKKLLSKMVVFNISYTIRSNKNKYHKAFKICNEQKNCGDLTPFLISFLEILLEASDDAFNKIKESIEKANHYNKINEILFDGQDLTAVLLQVSIFSDSGISIKELAEEIKKSEKTTKKYIDNLIKKNTPIISQKVGRKIKYAMDITRIDTIYNDFVLKENKC